MITRFVKYAIVGATGTAVDLGVFALLLIATPLGATFVGRVVAATMSFVLAVLNNYVLNRSWTFADRLTTHREQFTKFFAVSCVGWLIHIAAFSLFSLIFISIVAKAAASAVVLIYNYGANALWTFKRRSSA